MEAYVRVGATDTHYDETSHSITWNDLEGPPDDDLSDDDDGGLDVHEATTGITKSLISAAKNYTTNYNTKVTPREGDETDCLRQLRYAPLSRAIRILGEDTSGTILNTTATRFGLNIEAHPEPGELYATLERQSDITLRLVAALQLASNKNNNNLPTQHFEEAAKRLNNSYIHSRLVPSNEMTRAINLDPDTCENKTHLELLRLAQLTLGIPQNKTRTRYETANAVKSALTNIGVEHLCKLLTDVENKDIDDDETPSPSRTYTSQTTNGSSCTQTRTVNAGTAWRISTHSGVRHTSKSAATGPLRSSLPTTLFKNNYDEQEIDYMPKQASTTTPSITGLPMPEQTHPKTKGG